MGCGSFRTHPPVLVWGPPWAAVWVFAQLWTSMGCRGTACFTIVFSRGCRGISAPASEVQPPPPFSFALGTTYRAVSLLTATEAFFPFLNMFSLRHHLLGCWAQLCPAAGLVGAGWNSLSSPRLSLQLFTASAWAPAPSTTACLTRL